jgi:hypothetical protein
MLKILNKLFKKSPVVDWNASCGRVYLSINDFVVAVEGDPLRDIELTEVCMRLDQSKYGMTLDGKIWTSELIKYFVAEVNK